eukprot:TRINITY_DN22284_c0_g1_i9.p1 TRINITY_DN22284_c0_g1~~TRINITY_DN22284_c0_g1_i9.p1  ORF type:complete len:114 (-),score=3.78 TRINITY_DN22284_c0_g1_i9:43-384(-)
MFVGQLQIFYIINFFLFFSGHCCSIFTLDLIDLIFQIIFETGPFITSNRLVVKLPDLIMREYPDDYTELDADLLLIDWSSMQDHIGSIYDGVVDNWLILVLVWCLCWRMQCRL